MNKMNSFQALSIVRNLLATLSPEMLSISIPSLKEEGLLTLRDHTYKTIGELLNKLVGMGGAMNKPYIQAVDDISVIVACFQETGAQPTQPTLTNNLIAA